MYNMYIYIYMYIGAWGVGSGEYGAYVGYSIDNGSVYALDEAQFQF